MKPHLEARIGPTNFRVTNTICKHQVEFPDGTLTSHKVSTSTKRHKHRKIVFSHATSKMGAHDPNV